MMNLDAEEPEDLADTDRRGRRLKTQKQHADLVDEIEKGLSKALQDYRYHAEEVLARHLIELEHTEAAHELEVSKLRAENGRLRDALTLRGLEEPGLFQTILFSQTPTAKEAKTATTAPPKCTASVTSTTTAGSRATVRCSNEGENDKVTLNARGKCGKSSPEQPAGAWQHFVAWVPNGAALKSPEPWRPLPPECLTPVKGGVNMPALPGMVPNEGEEEESTKKKKRKNTDEDSESDEEEERDPWEVLEVWKATQRQLDRLRNKAGASEYASRFSGSDGSKGLEDEDDEAFEIQETPHCLITHPHSRKRAVWDMGSLMMVVWDMIMIPMSAFTLPESAFLKTMDWITRLFWTIDIWWSVTTGVVLPDGKINFEVRFIMKRYLKTWFALDMLIVGSDWMEVILTSTNVAGIGRLARITRISRVVRLLRLVRMQEVLQAITERVQSDKLSFVLSATKLLIFVLVNAHVIACLWWLVGVHHIEDGSTWVSVNGYNSNTLDSQYLVSLHWSLSQFTGGNDEVTPENTLERFYAVIAWVFGFMAAAVILSVMTSNLTHLHIIGGAHSRQLATLRKYLKQNRISSNLALRVQRSAQHAVTGDLAPDSVELLAVVAEPLRVEMNFEMYSAILGNHPFFTDYIYEDPQVIRRVCHFGMSMVLLAKGDVVFSKGELPREPKMYFVVKGLLDYYCRGDTVTIGERQWAAEAALWTTWTHRGTLTSSTDVKMAALDSKTFRDLVHRFRGKKSFDPRLYASEFVEHLNKTSKVDDLTFMS